MDKLVSLCATRAAESKWRLMGADNLAQAVQTFKARIRRSIGVEGARGLARLRLANLVQVHSFNRGSLSSCQLRQREKAYYYDARETHYNRFGPHAWFDRSQLPLMPSISEHVPPRSLERSTETALPALEGKLSALQIVIIDDSQFFSLRLRRLVRPAPSRATWSDSRSGTAPWLPSPASPRRADWGGQAPWLP